MAPVFLRDCIRTLPDSLGELAAFLASLDLKVLLAELMSVTVKSAHIKDMTAALLVIGEDMKPAPIDRCTEAMSRASHAAAPGAASIFKSLHARGDTSSPTQLSSQLLLTALMIRSSPSAIILRGNAMESALLVWSTTPRASSQLSNPSPRLVSASHARMMLDALLPKAPVAAVAARASSLLVRMAPMPASLRAALSPLAPYAAVLKSGALEVVVAAIKMGEGTHVVADYAYHHLAEALWRRLVDAAAAMQALAPLLAAYARAHAEGHIPRSEAASTGVLLRTALGLLRLLARHAQAFEVCAAQAVVRTGKQPPQATHKQANVLALLELEAALLAEGSSLHLLSIAAARATPLPRSALPSGVPSALAAALSGSIAASFLCAPARAAIARGCAKALWGGEWARGGGAGRSGPPSHSRGCPGRRRCARHARTGGSPRAAARGPPSP